MMDWDGGMGAGGWVLMTLLWVVLVVAVVWAVANLFPGRAAAGADIPERPEDILDRRLARGEIDAQTYDELRSKLVASRAERM